MPPKTERISPPYLARHIFQSDEPQAKGRNVAEGTAHTGFLVMTRAWFHCLSIWWFSPLSGNIFSILYLYTIDHSVEQLETKQVHSYKNGKYFLVHFNDNFLICVIFIMECNHLLSKTIYLGENDLVCFWVYLYGVDFRPGAEGAVQVLGLRASNPAAMFSWNGVPVFWN